MDILQIAILTMQIMNVFPKKYASSSDESIENLLYYKDCQHKAKDATEMPVLLRAEVTSPPRKPDCPFPKMCCSLSCGDDCGSNQPFGNRQAMDAMPGIQPLQPFQPSPIRQPQAPIQPQAVQRGRKKKGKFPAIQIPATGTRRSFGFTKEKIKGLISKDEDIRKILKDLVRVTMQKVDLQDMMHAENNEHVNQPESVDDDYD